MSSKIEYPKPLPDLVYKNIHYETGFYPTEAVALINGWRLVKRCLINHSMKISTNFYSEHFYLLERFRHVETKKIDCSSFHQHTHQIMNIYGRLIESGLNDLGFINMLLSDVKNKHKFYAIELDEIRLITNYIKKYLLDFLDKVKSTTFENGIKKLSQLIVDYHKEEAKAEDSSSDKKNK